MSGPRIGKRGRSNTKGGHKQANGRLVSRHTTAELYAVVRTGQGKDRQKCQNELVKRRLPTTPPEEDK